MPKKIKNDELKETIDSELLTVDNKETELQTSVYSKITLTDDELSAAKSLQDDFTEFLKTTQGLTPDYSIRNTVPTGIDLLDVLMGGGAATGLLQIIGPPGSGKSALAAKIIATSQRKFKKLTQSVYMDGEDSTDKRRLMQLGVTQPPVQPYTRLSVEAIFRCVEGMCNYKLNHNEVADIPWVVTWDSIANTHTEAALHETDPNKVTGLKARILAHLLPIYIPKMNEFNISLVAVNQLRDKIDMGVFKTPSDLQFLANKKIPGGSSSLYNSIQILYITPCGRIEGEYGFYGTRVKCKLIKNKLFTPNIEFEMVFSFERGFSNFFTNYELLKKTKRISMGGAWGTLLSYPEKKFQQSNVIKMYNDNEEFREAFNNDVKDVLKTEYIDVYTSTQEDAIG